MPLAYRPDIDGLRAISVLAVVLYHAFPKGGLAGGFAGVDVFFVISGYLISLVLLGDLHADRLSLIDFYTRRIRRILPALLMVMLFCLAIGWAALFSVEFKQLGLHTAASAALAANLILWSEVGYFDNAAELKPLLHLWSLAVEEQFYILWPAILLLLHRVKLNPAYPIAFLGALSFAACLHGMYNDPTAAFYSPLSRFWELLAGAGLACWTAGGGSTPRRLGNPLAVAGTALLATGFLAIDATSPFPGFATLLPVGGASLLISAGPAAWVNRTVLASKPLVAIGLVSYPLYLWHWPLLSFQRIGNFDDTYREVSVLARSSAVLIAFALAWATFRLVEKPIRFGRSRQRWAMPLGLSMGAVGLAGLVVFLANGMPSRIALDPPSAAVLFQSYPHPQKNEACQRHYPEYAYYWSCLLSKPRPPDIALLGDSHAHQYYQSLAANLPELSVLNLSVPGCLPFTSSTAFKSTAHCDDKTEMMVKFIADNPSIRTVVLTGYFSFLAAGFRYRNAEGERVAADLDPANQQRFEASADRLLRSLVEQQRRIVVLVDIPDLIFSPRDCVSFQNPIIAFLRGRIRSRHLDECGIAVDTFKARMDDFDSTLAAILAKYEGITVLDTRPALCDAKMCRAFKDGRFLYWNSDHLTREGADLVIERLARELGR